MGDLDRRKHDVDVIERVLGGIRDTARDDSRTRIVGVSVPADGGSSRSILEVIVGVGEEESRAEHR